MNFLDYNRFLLLHPPRFVSQVHCFGSKHLIRSFIETGIAYIIVVVESIINYRIVFCIFNLEYLTFFCNFAHDF